MSQELVADVRLRGVHGHGGVADVLGGVEDAERQAWGGEGVLGF